MQFATFSRTGITVSRLCLGTATFGKQTEESVSRQILDTAADTGVNFIDTADAYPMGADAALLGRTEELVGRWLKGKRERFIIATKAGGQTGPSPWDQGSSRTHLLDAIDASLRRLKTDYIDLYQLHIDDAATPLDESLEALDLIVARGRLVTLAYRIFSPTALLGLLAAQKGCALHVSSRCSHAITFCSGRLSVNCCRSPRKRTWR
jgi:1-deoxyxylulose-5-phosphate synthase